MGRARKWREERNGEGDTRRGYVGEIGVVAQGGGVLVRFVGSDGGRYHRHVFFRRRVCSMMIAKRAMNEWIWTIALGP